MGIESGEDVGGTTWDCRVDGSLRARPGADGRRELHDVVPVFRVDRLREIHRALHVGKEYRHLLPLAFEGGARGQDLLGKVLWGVGARLRWWWRVRVLSDALSAVPADCSPGSFSALQEAQTNVSLAPQSAQNLGPLDSPGHTLSTASIAPAMVKQASPED